MVFTPAALFCALALAIFVEIVIGATILQLSCVLFNVFAGVSSKRAGKVGAWMRIHSLNSETDWTDYDRIAAFPGVPSPGFDRAVRIVFLATLINVPGTLIIFQLLRMVVQANVPPYRGFVPTACIALPMGILVLAALNTVRLPTRFRKGVLISLLSHLFGAILATVIVLIVLTFRLHG